MRVWINFFLLCLMITSFAVEAAPRRKPVPPRTREVTMHEYVQLKIKETLLAHFSGLANQPTIQIEGPDPKIPLPVCRALEVIPLGQLRPYGRAMVSVRCPQPRFAFTLPVQLNLTLRALVAARPLPAGTVISPQDLGFRDMDASLLPPNLFTQPEEVLGRTLVMGVSMGIVLRSEQFKAHFAVQARQPVKVVYRAEGFEVSAEGMAQGSAREGQAVQVRVQSGVIIQGVARQGGIVEVYPSAER